MVEASSTLSGLGFSPLDYVAMWSNAALTNQASSTATRRGGSVTTSALTQPSSDTQASYGAAQSASTGSRLAAGNDISLQVELDIARLKAAAQEALRNRAAQMAAGGAYVGGSATYAYSLGPDGQLYASGVTLSYDTNPISDNPQATIQKMQRVRAAALASSAPTAADYAAATAATQVEMEARLELVRKMTEQYLGPETTSASNQAGTLLNAQA